MVTIYPCPNCRVVIKDGIIRWSCDDRHSEFFKLQRKGTSIMDHDEEREMEEIRTSPDFYIEPGTRCVVCRGIDGPIHPIKWVCSDCGGATHFSCGEDTEPSGGWDRDFDVNYWVCKNCLNAAEKAYQQEKRG